MIKINLKATNIVLTDAIRTYVEEKIGSLARLVPADDESVLAQVEVGKTTQHHQQGEVFRAEVNFHFRGGDLYAEEINEDLYAAVDGVRDDITHQINAKIEKRNTLVRRGGRGIKNLLRGLNPWRHR
jgi:putative sigma-54 modulation protein